MTARGPVRPPLAAETSGLRPDAQGGALCHIALEASRCTCGATKGTGYWFCRRCAATLPGGVLYDLRAGIDGAFARALEILHS